MFWTSGSSTFYLAQRCHDDVGRRHWELADATLGQRLRVGEARFVGVGPVLHAHNLLERRESRLHVRVKVLWQRPRHGVFEELTCEDSLCRHGRVTLKSRHGVVVVVGPVEHVCGAAVAHGRGHGGDRRHTGGCALGGDRHRGTPAVVDSDGQVTQHVLDVCEAALKVVDLSLAVLQKKQEDTGSASTA